MELLQPAMWHDHDIDFVRWLHTAMWLWNRDSEFTKWQHPAMWYVALGWHAIFAQTSAGRHIGILHLVSISTHHRSRHVILYQSAKCYYYCYYFINTHKAAVIIKYKNKQSTMNRKNIIGPPSAEKNDVMSIFKMAYLSHLGLYGFHNGFFGKPS